MVVYVVYHSFSFSGGGQGQYRDGMWSSPMKYGHLVNDARARGISTSRVLSRTRIWSETRGLNAKSEIVVIGLDSKCSIFREERFSNILSVI